MSSLTKERDAVESARKILESRTWPLRSAEREKIAADLNAAVQRYDAAINAMRRAPSDA